MSPDALRRALGELRDNYRDPWWWQHSLGEAVHRYLNGPIQRLHPAFGDGDPVADADWDTLVVLDACRADLFEAVADTDTFDHYERRRSTGSMTREWTRRNFADGDFGDTVYVATNPYTTAEAGDSFHHVDPLWERAFDETLGTVPHDAVIDAARAAVEEYPAKRHVVHVLQPHHPFVADDRVAAFSGWDVDTLADGDRPPHPHDPFEAQSMGLVDEATNWRAYRDTLGLVLDDVLDLARDLRGRSVVTSDHGNMFGDPGWPIPLPVYGHPSGLRQSELVEVPWAVLADDPRPSIHDGGTDADTEAADAVEERLRDLGYT